MYICVVCTHVPEHCHNDDVMAAFFDERSGIVPCKTPWGCWWQTIEEVYIEVNLSEPIKSKLIKCDITPSSLSLSVADKTFLKVAAVFLIARFVSVSLRRKRDGLIYYLL